MNSVPFYEALEDCSRLAGKVPQASCLPNGEIPVIGQGKRPVEGFTNDYGLLFSGDLPVILFGNHTATFKFIDHPFARGADGTKLFRPRDQRLNAKYAWHFLQTVRLPQTGYDRKTKYLEGIEIPLPPLEEQRRIAAILDKASRIAELCGTALKLSHAADKSLFLHFFADLPEESDLLLEELADKRSNAIRTGPFGSQLLHGEFTDSGVAVLGIDNAVNNSFEWSKRRFISHEKYEQLKRYTVCPGDLLITIMGTCGRAAVVPDDIPQAINTKHLCAISVDRSVVLPEYLHSYILFHPSASRYLSQRTKGAIMEGLNMTIIKELPVAVPPVSHQMAWLARRKILRAASKRAQSMSASALSLRQSFSYNLLEERGA